MQLDHTENIIELEDVSFAYPGDDAVVRNVTLQVHRGDYLGVIGPNGGGKTTLLKLMLGLLKPTRGTVRLFGRDVREFREWYKIGYVPQKATNFDKHFPATAEEVVAMGTYGRRGLFHGSTAQDRERVSRALQHVQMFDFRRERIGDLSGGQQQRIFIARSLAADPEVVFLDEPTVGVDTNAQEEFYRLLRKLNRDLQLTLVLVSHELNIVSQESTEVACINGDLVCYSTPEELFAQGGIEKLYGRKLQYLSHEHHAHVDRI